MRTFLFLCKYRYNIEVPSEWERLLEIKVIDPDGWRQKNKRWDERITLNEFVALASHSTISC